MNWKGIAGALVTTVLTACVDSVPPVAPDHSNVMPALISVAQAKPLSYVPEVPNGSSFYRPIHMADMDGDGRAEILIGSWSTDRIEIWKYDAAQKKALLVQQTPAFPYDIHGLSTGDMDKDGDLDILAAIRGYGVFLALNNGAGSWTVSNLYPTYAWNTQVADIDRDGHLDVFASLNGGAVVILYGEGDGTFTAVAGPAFGLTMSINLADFNNDGLPDLIGPDMVLGRMMAYQNLGGRVWSANLGPSAYFPHQLRSEYTPSALDLYGNGNLDQIAAFFTANSYVPPMSVVIFEGMGAPASPSWTPRILDVLPYNGFPLGGADLDDDGNLDVFVGGST